MIALLPFSTLASSALVVNLLERLCKQVEGERDNLREQNTRLTALLPAPKTEEQPKSL